MKLMQTPLRGLFLLALCGVGANASATRVENLYAAEVPMPAGSDGLQAAFATALDEVLVKATGDREIAGDELIRARFGEPDRFVQLYRINPHGNLWVRFDEVALRRELDAIGAPIWGSERPATLVWMVMDYGLGRREIVARPVDPAGATGLSIREVPALSSPDGVRAAVQRAARMRGLPIIWPHVDAQELISISLGDVWSGFTSGLAGSSRRYAPDAVLVGRGYVVSADVIDVRWTLLLDDERFDWTGDVASGPNDLADFFAARLATSSGSSHRISFSVDGVDNLNDYGRLSEYLTGLDLVEHYSVDQVTGQRIIFTLQVRGDTQRLMRSIALQSVLQPVADPLRRSGDHRFGKDIDRVNLHYRLIAGP